MPTHLLTALAELPEAVYSDPNYFAAELSHVFRSRDCFALHTTRLVEVGERHCLLVGGRELILIRTASEGLRAFPNRCLHKGDPILECGASGRSDVMRCPHHGWTYGLDGHLLGGPGFTTRQERAPFLPEITCSVVGSLVIVRPEGTSEPGGNLAGSSTRAVSLDEVSVPVETMRVAANWKLVVAVLSDREWISALPNLLLRYHEAGRLLVRMEPVAPHTTCLEVTWASDISTTRDYPRVDLHDLLIAATEAEARQRLGRGSYDRSLPAALATTTTAIDRAIESAASYLLFDGR